MKVRKTPAGAVICSNLVKYHSFRFYLSFIVSQLNFRAAGSHTLFLGDPSGPSRWRAGSSTTQGPGPALNRKQKGEILLTKTKDLFKIND